MLFTVILLASIAIGPFSFYAYRAGKREQGRADQWFGRVGFGAQLGAVKRLSAAGDRFAWWSYWLLIAWTVCVPLALILAIVFPAWFRG